MPIARKFQISIEATPYYHCVSRCVRRAFLCGNDWFTGRSYDHRRQFIETEMHRLGKIFFLEIAAYAVMSNHFHVVLFIDQDAQKIATSHDVVSLWHQIHQGNPVSTKFLNQEPLDPHEQQQLDGYIDLWRNRLMSISWFMRVLNEKVARKANAEDAVTGRFWEGRFKCQALLDEQALLSCMAYVDLNPVRAGISKTPETSDHTSIKYRIHQLQQVEEIHPARGSTKNDLPQRQPQPTDLLPFAGDIREPTPKGIPFNLLDYLELVDWTGRQIRENKGAINADAPSLLQRLSIEPKHWIYLCTNFESRFKILVGSLATIERVYRKFKRKRKPNLSAIIERLV